ncbi:MAG: AAA family ATPase, partial [Bacteroidales bacterium]|nr:AAA family ATPase [Bacteroidales bacterium]
TDNKGRTVDFKNTILIMTSNVGSDIIQDAISEGTDFDTCRDKVMELLKHSVRPEFLNRIDEIIMFHPLSRENVREILKIQMADLKGKLAAMDIDLEFTDQFVDYLSDKGYNPVYGARPIKRVLQRDLIDELAKQLLDGSLSKAKTITADIREGEIVLS